MTLLQHQRDGEVLKLMSGSASAPLIRWAEESSTPHLNRYVQHLRDGGVRLPAELRIVVHSWRPAVQHQWVPGVPVPDLAGTDPEAFLAAVGQIAAWATALKVTPARLDTNLANFISTGDGLVCIDVLPPLLADLRPAENNDWERLFGALCYDVDITLCALAGYAARTLLAAAAALSPGQVDDLPGLCPGHPDPGILPVRWFHNRLDLAVAALRRQLPAKTVLSAFGLSSVLRLRNTPILERQPRIDAALTSLSSHTSRIRSS
ncbi:hypothetical protein [Acrocarpospora sp. B8E8]|uniref:hypothetical protein n=1 Tax=Acrocarpospora sp. B8E8 TaxID=3153572 RepID=UPI00325C4C7B